MQLNGPVLGYIADGEYWIRGDVFEEVAGGSREALVLKQELVGRGLLVTTQRDKGVSYVVKRSPPDGTRPFFVVIRRPRRSPGAGSVARGGRASVVREPTPMALSRRGASTRVSRSAPRAWRVKGRTAENFIDRRRASAPPMCSRQRSRLPRPLLEQAGPAGIPRMFERIAGSGSEAALQAALHSAGISSSPSGA